MKDKKGTLIELMKNLSYKHGLWTVFTNFLEIVAISISNSVDKSSFTEREQKYLKLVSNYDAEELNMFARMFAELIKLLEEDPTDILGELFMSLNLSNKWKGQFFTPMSICKLCADISCDDVENQIIKDGYITLNEPACGGGAMIIAYALALKDKGFNYQKHLLVTAADLDIIAVYMTYIQLSLLGIPGVVCHSNTLTVEVFSQWYTPMYIVNNWNIKYFANIAKQNIDYLSRVS